MIKFSDIWIWGVVLSIFLGIALIIYKSFKQVEFENPQKTIGVIIETRSLSSGSESVLEYYVNDKKYETTSGDHTGTVIGEKYEIIYEKNDPEKAVCQSMNPVFEKGEYTWKDTAKIIRKNFGNRRIEYEYFVGKIKIVRWQDYNSKIYNNIKKGQSYEVEYLLTDPRRAIIHLDKLIIK